jgi:hypothetical protein
MPEEISQLLCSLPQLSCAQLRSLWYQIFTTKPSCQWRRRLLIRFLAYKIQEQTYTTLSSATRRRLRQLARDFENGGEGEIAASPRIKPGTRLVREWRDRIHVVNVEDEGYEYKGTRYDSLSQIARLITGTRWSGPLFFGLKRKPEGKEPSE